MASKLGVDRFQVVKNGNFKGLICRFFLQQIRELEILFEDNVGKLLEKLILEKV